MVLLPEKTGIMSMSVFMNICMFYEKEYRMVKFGRLCREVTINFDIKFVGAEENRMCRKS